jgi:hypothetical protein
MPAHETQTGVPEVQQVPAMNITPDSAARQTSLWRAFWDFFVLFSGISTRSNLSRTRKEPILSRGVFLFRSRKH